VGLLENIFGRKLLMDENELCNSGNRYLRKNQLDDAIEIYKRVIDINPLHAPAWSNLGVAFQYSHRIDLAIVALKKATSIAPEYANAWHNLGNAYFMTDQRDMAVEAYEQAIRIEPRHAAQHNLELCQKNEMIEREIMWAYMSRLDTVASTNIYFDEAERYANKHGEEINYLSNNRRGISFQTLVKMPYHSKNKKAVVNFVENRADGTLDLRVDSIDPLWVTNLVKWAISTFSSNAIDRLVPLDEIFPLDAKGMEQLTELDLSFKGLTELPTEIFMLKNLRRLNLTNNSLTELPPEIGGFYNLSSLYIEGNLIEKLPPELSNIPSLRVIDDMEKLPLELTEDFVKRWTCSFLEPYEDIFPL